MQALTNEQIKAIVSNHKGEELLLFKEEDQNGYHSITIEVGFYDLRHETVISSLEDWGYTSSDVENGLLQEGIFVVESYGTSGARNDYICPLFDGYNTQAEEQINWVRALVYETKAAYFEAEHPGRLNEQGWGQASTICNYCKKCSNCVE